MDTFEKFLYSYIIMLFFLVWIIGAGAGDFFTDSNITDFEAPDPPTTPTATGNPILDWINNAVASGEYFYSNIVFFFTIMTVDTGIKWFTTLVMTPGIIFLIYGVLKHLIRG